MLHLTEKNFTAEINRSSIPVVVMFYARWCGKCAMMKPMIEELEKKYRGHTSFCEVEIDESTRLTDEYGADIVPTFAFFQRGRCLGTMQGIIEDNVFERRLQKIFRNS